MKKIAWKLAVVLSTLFLLTSCSDKKIVELNLKYIPTDRVPANVTDKQSQEQIADAASAVGQSLQQLSAVQMTVHPPKKLPTPFNPQALGMDKTASISWTGPAEPILQKIAEATNYNFRVIGKRPAIPALVSLDMHNKPIADILRNIMYQVVMKADVAVYARSKTIELRYHEN